MFETLSHVGGFGFLVFTLLVLAAGVLSAELDSITGAVVTFILMIGGAVFLFDFPVLDSVFGNLFLSFVALVAYTVIGLAYGVWYRYSEWLNKRSNSISREYERFVSEYSKKHKGEFPSNEEFRQSHHYSPFLPIKNINRISTWIALWPWALFWDLCHKPVRALYNTVYSIAARGLNSVSAKISDKIINEHTNKK